MTRIAFFGEAMQELSASDTLSFGGDTYNTAVYLKRLIGTQAEVYFISATGSDKLSLIARSQWKQQGLNLDFLQ